MFVEKLSVFGFKSFNQKVTLDFGTGISGVIGPNGCGKSNIVDALRWVLGEQSTKQLRGTKMEDVIFNGTRTEKPLSLAEVYLTLNNDAGRLPIEYGTVTVGRRLYRSGVSEYVINKKPVRLKDVRDLFLDTGMGSHAYSVIERQMVDNILSDTTGHRRFLFEEAAGIMKYKTRKREALTKLEATDRDLLRVQDIISEVERQVNSLKRQVGKARRYREISTEIRELDLAVSQRQRALWVASLTQLRDVHGEDLMRSEGADTEVATLEARVEELRRIVLEEDRRLATAREALAEVDDAIGESNSRVLVLRERHTASKTRIREAQERRVRLIDRLERNAQSQEESTARLQALQSREEDERQELDGAEAHLATVETRVRAEREQLAGTVEEAATLRDETIRAESAVVRVGQRLTDLGERLATVDERAESGREQAREVIEALDVSRESVRRAGERVAELTAELEELDQLGRTQGERMESVRKELETRRQAEAAARSRLSTLEDLRASYEGYDPGVRAVLLDDGRDEGVVGTLSDLLALPQEWMAALEPALSAVWQTVVVRETETAKRILGRLQSESLGYAVLLPLDRVPDANAPSGEGVWASEVVETDPAYRSLVRSLLQDLLLVDTLDEALEAVRSGRTRRAATRTGQVVDGATVGGGVGGPAGSELVEREEGLEQCRREIDGVLGELAELTERFQTLRAEGETIEANRGAKRSDLAQAVEARAALSREETSLAEQARHAESTLAALDAERGTLENERAQQADEQARLEASLNTSARDAEQAATRRTEAQERTRAAEAERETVLAGVHELKMAWARLEGELSDATTGAERLRAEAIELTEERERTDTDEAEARQRVEEIDGELETLAARIEVLHRDREGKSETVAQRERERSEAAAREHKDSDTLREVRRRAQDARQAAHKAELEISQLTGELRHLEERLAQEYEVTPGDLDQVVVDALPEDAEDRLDGLRERLRRIGPVNLLAVEEYEEKSTRLEFMTSQRDDLHRAKDSLIKTIAEINKTASKMFMDTFALVAENFQKTFKVLFQGGECSLTLTGDDPLESDIEVVARPRGKKPQSIAQLSSGERALTAIALLFAIYLVKPSPFCILDEVDAPLDDANIDRFVAMVKEFSKRTQFIVITHNKKTMEAADCLYGVTMQRPGVSTVVSVKLEGDRAADLPSQKDSNGAKDSAEPESVIAQ